MMKDSINEDVYNFIEKSILYFEQNCDIIATLVDSLKISKIEAIIILLSIRTYPNYVSEMSIENMIEECKYNPGSIMYNSIQYQNHLNGKDFGNSLPLLGIYLGDRLQSDDVIEKYLTEEQIEMHRIRKNNMII